MFETATTWATVSPSYSFFWMVTVLSPTVTCTSTNLFHAPNANAFAERWVRSARAEYLNHLILFGLDSLRRVVRQFKVFYNENRPHQGIGNRVSAAKDAQGIIDTSTSSQPVGKVQCDQYLGGLLKSYRRAA